MTNILNEMLRDTADPELVKGVVVAMVEGKVPNITEALKEQKWLVLAYYAYLSGVMDARLNKLPKAAQDFVGKWEAMRKSILRGRADA